MKPLSAPPPPRALQRRTYIMYILENLHALWFKDGIISSTYDAIIEIVTQKKLKFIGLFFVMLVCPVDFKTESLPLMSRTKVEKQMEETGNYQNTQ